ncbi:MAG: ferritin family protein [Desulfobulbaceae bacterium]|nr:ferritin family protein [Desulfobulbaceae bacterium]
MLSGRGFEKIFNLSGGIKGWNGEVAFGPREAGLEIFTRLGNLEEVLRIAYSLEAGLRDFYLRMLETVKNGETKKVFQFLSAVELKHQDKLLNRYCSLIGKRVSHQEFEVRVTMKLGEGALTTDEYINLFGVNAEEPGEAVTLAMAIEAQAQDLYHRAAQAATSDEIRYFFIDIVQEEKSHLKMLGELMDTF